MDLNQFTLELIRKKNIEWLEERRFDWVPLIADFVSNVIEGKTVLLITDYKRRWFADNLIHKINNFQDFKPSFIPVFDLIKLVPLYLLGEGTLFLKNMDYHCNQF